METPGAFVEARVPSVSVPVCVVTSVPVCVVKGVSETPCMEETPCVKETLCVEETPCMKETPCVSGVVTSVPGCVLPSTPCMSEQPVCVDEAPRVREAACAREAARVCEARCVSGATCAPETARVCEQPCGSEARRVSERPCVRRTACVRSLCVREMSVGMHEHAAASPRVSVNLMECSLGVVTRRCAWVEWRRRLRQLRDKSRVAAVVAFGTVPGLHGSVRMVRAVQRTRPPRARLRE